MTGREFSLGFPGGLPSAVLATSLFLLRLFYCNDSRFSLAKCEVLYTTKAFINLLAVYYSNGMCWNHSPGCISHTVRFGPWASSRREGVIRCSFSLGIDKENVELSPTTGHCNSGRTRHGSASQVQKQRSAGSFKRNSIKKIVWSFLSFPFQTNLTWASH